MNEFREKDPYSLQVNKMKNSDQKDTRNQDTLYNNTQCFFNAK